MYAADVQTKIYLQIFLVFSSSKFRHKNNVLYKYTLYIAPDYGNKTNIDVTKEGMDKLLLEHCTTPITLTKRKIHDTEQMICKL